MEQFSLEKYNKNPNRRIVTRDGRSVRVVCPNYKAEADKEYVLVLIYDNFNNRESIAIVTKEGKRSYCNNESNSDLFFAPEKHEGWINLYQMDYGNYANSDVYPTKEEAERYGKFSSHASYVDTCKIEWEE